MLQSISLRRLLLAVLALAFGLAATLVPGGVADAAHDRNGEAVDGFQQAYNGARASGGGDTDVAPTLFFHGNKPDPIFNAEEPTGSEPQEQVTDPQADPTTPGDPSAAYWAGDYSGDLTGTLNFRWYWSTINPGGTLIRVDATVTVFADPEMTGDPEPDRIIGRQNVSFSASPPDPTKTDQAQAEDQIEITNVPVKGVANERILIQVVPTYSDTGPLLTTTYDSDDFPGGFEFVPAGDAPTTPESTPAEYDGEPFRVQAVNVGRDAAEPTIGVNKDGTAFYAAGAFDALPAGSPTNLARTEVLRSRDGGLTWESVQPPALMDQTTLPPTTLDPYVYVEEESGRMFNPELYAGCTYLQFSDDEGESYETSPAACGEFVNDHQTVFAGPPPPNLEGQLGDEKFPEVLYYCFNRVVDSNCGRSLDGGRTWGPAPGDNFVGTAFIGYDPDAGGLCGGLHGHVATDSEGRLFMPKGHCGFPWIGISEDGAETWERVQISDKIGAAGTHLSVAVDAADNLYFVWWDTAEHLPYLATSTDHGKTWSEPLMIAPPGVHEVNFPVIYAGDEGRIAINFPGTTVDDQDNKKRPWNQYIVASTNALDANPLFVSTTANELGDPIHRGDCLGRCSGMFDFLDVIVSPHDGDIWATATDTCTNDREEGEPDSEAVNCVENPDDLDGNGGESPNVANDEEGYAIRQLSGPRMLAAVQDTDQDRTTDPDEGAPDPTTDDGVGDDDADRAPVLPATGGGLGLMLIGAAIMPVALLIGRRRR